MKQVEEGTDPLAAHPTRPACLGVPTHVDSMAFSRELRCGPELRERTIVVWVGIICLRGPLVIFDMPTGAGSRRRLVQNRV